MAIVIVLVQMAPTNVEDLIQAVFIRTQAILNDFLFNPSTNY